MCVCVCVCVCKQMRNSDFCYSVIGDIYKQISVLCRNLICFNNNVTLAC